MWTTEERKWEEGKERTATMLKKWRGEGLATWQSQILFFFSGHQNNNFPLFRFFCSQTHTSSCLLRCYILYLFTSTRFSLIIFLPHTSLSSGSDMKNRLFVSADTGARTLGFFCAWRDSTTLGCFTHTFIPGWGSFQLHVHRNEDNYVCSIRIDSSDDTKKYTEFKSCSLRVHEGDWLVSNTIQLKPIHTIDQHC